MEDHPRFLAPINYETIRCIRHMLCYLLCFGSTLLCGVRCAFIIVNKKTWLEESLFNKVDFIKKMFLANLYDITLNPNSVPWA